MIALGYCTQHLTPTSYRLHIRAVIDGVTSFHVVTAGPFALIHRVVSGVVMRTVFLHVVISTECVVSAHTIYVATMSIEKDVGNGGMHVG